MENRLLVLAQLISNIKNEEDINTVNDEILSIFRTRYDSEIEQLAKLNLNTSEEEVKKIIYAFTKDKIDEIIKETMDELFKNTVHYDLKTKAEV